MALFHHRMRFSFFSKNVERPNIKMLLNWLGNLGAKFGTPTLNGVVFVVVFCEYGVTPASVLS